MARTPVGALDALQHQLYQLITEPSGAPDVLPDGSALGSLIRGDRSAAPVDRLAIYANAWFARLHDCLRDDFGALARALGPDAFHDLCKTYLMIYAPSQPSLQRMGAHLADHLAAEPFAEIFARRCAWAADLARLEWAINEAFTAPDAPVLAREDLAAVPPEAWAELRFEATPSLLLLTCEWPVQIARERFEREDAEAPEIEPPVLAQEPTHLRVWRRDEQVRFAAVTPLELAVLEDLRRGDPFAALCDRVAAEVGEADAAAQAAAFLSMWIGDGVLARLTTS
ncbi:MAG TPA: putative DNA-binding domain-containing protein [Myxococcota bacterium]|nr:putative DNA-binding domain-containing protein [Myxococcota bacterium]